MPELYFTPDQESSWLQENGYDPTKFSINPISGEVLPKRRIQPAFNADQQVDQIPVNLATDEKHINHHEFGW